MSHRRALAVAVAVLVVAPGPAATAHAAEDAGTTTDHAVPVTMPEGVAWHAPSKTFFTGAAFEGTIARGTLDGERATVFSAGERTGRREALGMLTDAEHLYVAGGSTGSLLVYDIGTGDEVDRHETGIGGTLNDVALTPDGDLLATDSLRPAIFRIRGGTVETFTLTPEVTYRPGFNANGVRATKDGEYALFVDTDDNALYRMTLPADPADREITEVPISGGGLAGPDGIELLGHTLYVVNNAAETISKIDMSDDYSAGTVVGETTSPRFHTPTTISYVPSTDQLLVANAEFFDPSEPGAPYFVTAIPAP